MKTPISKTGLTLILFFFIHVLSFGQNPAQQIEGSIVIPKDTSAAANKPKSVSDSGPVGMRRTDDREEEKTYGSGPVGAARSVKVTIRNTTAYGLLLTSCNLGHGIWTSRPPGVIKAYQTVIWQSESNGIATGTAGVARFDMFLNDRFVDGELALNWNDPFVGSNSYSWSRPVGFAVTQTGGGGNNASVEFTLTSTGTPIFKAPLNLGHSPVTSLSIRIKTADVGGAGTDNSVYFSVGPLSWELTKQGTQFERNSDQTYPLPVKGNLYTDDIVWLKLEKKGVGGFHGTSDFPDGEWQVDFVELTINGQIKIKRPVNRVLSSPQDPFWTSIVQLNKMATPEDIVANTTRFVPNDQAVKGIVSACTYTAMGKMKGISGWIPVNGVANACVTGKLMWQPTLSSDAFATIDIQLEQIVLNGRTFNFTAARPRYIRFEYKVQNNCITNPLPVGTLTELTLNTLRDQLMQQKKLPNAGQRVTTCGVLRWDTDEGGHYEIHPAIGAIKIL